MRKSFRSRANLIALAGFMSVTMLGGESARADDLNFSPTGEPVWDLTTPNWVDPLTGQSLPWPNSAGDTAIFTAPEHTINLAADGIQVGNMGFTSDGNSDTPWVINGNGHALNLSIGDVGAWRSAPPTVQLNATLRGTGLSLSQATVSLLGSDNQLGFLSAMFSQSQLIVNAPFVTSNLPALTLTGSGASGNSVDISAGAVLSIVGGSIVEATTSAPISFHDNGATLSITGAGSTLRRLKSRAVIASESASQQRGNHHA